MELVLLVKIQSSKAKLSDFSCNGGELFNKICAESETVDERQIARFMGQICKAFTYIHSKNIIHLDLKVSGPKEAHTYVSSLLLYLLQL